VKKYLKKLGKWLLKAIGKGIADELSKSKRTDTV